MNKKISAIVGLLIGIAPLIASASDLGPLKVYKGSGEDSSLRVSVVQMGKAEDRRMLIAYNATGRAEGNIYGVYKGECDTTSCERIMYIVVGGSTVGMLTNGANGRGRHQVFIEGRKEAVSVYFDENLTSMDQSELVYKRYLASIGQVERGLASGRKSAELVNASAKVFQQACDTKAPVKITEESFEKAKQSHLVGMGQSYLYALAVACKDKDYKTAIAKFKQIEFAPSETVKEVKVENQNVTIYISSDIYNPQEVARSWIKKL